MFRLQVQEGGTYIDATMGKGRDTLFLCEMAKETGRVLAFDIQEAALCATDRLLKEQGVRDRAELYLDSHVHMDRYMPPESADGIYFNFGYLPGGDHRLATRGDTSVKAIDAGLSLLKKMKGLKCFCLIKKAAFLTVCPASESLKVNNLISKKILSFFTFLTTAEYIFPTP